MVTQERDNVWMEAVEILVDLGYLEHDEVITVYKKALTQLKEACSNVNTGIHREEYVIFILAASLLLLITLIMRMKYDIFGFRFAFNYILFAALLIAEIAYLIDYDNPLWLCVPDDVGWSTAIISFILLFGIILLQLFYFMISMIDCAENYRADVNLKLGFFSLLVGMIAIVVCRFCWAGGIVYIIIGMALAQLAQYILILIACAKGRRILFAIPFIFLYTIGILLLLLVIFLIIA